MEQLLIMLTLMRWIYDRHNRILDIAPHRPHSAFDMFGVFMLEMDDDDFVTNVSHDAISVEGASDSMDPTLSFDTMSGFITH